MEKRSNIHTFCNQKDLKAKYECRPSETLTAKDQLPLPNTTGNDLFLLRILFFPPQDFLIPIRHLGSAIQLTEEVSVVHSTFFSFPTQNNYVRKKGDLNFKLHRQQEFTPFGWCRRFSTKPGRRIQCSLTWGSMAGATGKYTSVLVN